MSFERPITIKETIDNIHRKKYLLPAIQRELVWSEEKITLLFDSLMRGYPIGAFLFWLVEKDNSKSYQFYEFLRNYHEGKSIHNPKANVAGDSDITAILDGQQRLTALYMGLKGSAAYKLPRKRWNNPDAFPKKVLCLNLLAPPEEPTDMQYDFQFIEEEICNNNDIEKNNAFWFRVGDILDMEAPSDVNDYLIDKGLNTLVKSTAKFANRTLFRLYDLVHKTEVINYFLEKDESLDKVLNIFIRVNSGGTILSYSDLLLSIATAQWKKRDAREEIHNFVDEINGIGDSFNFGKDFVLKSCLVLSDFTDIAFKVDNFNAKNMAIIEGQWDRISEAIRLAVHLLASFGYNRDTLTSNNAVIPIAYYLDRIGLPKNYAQSRRFLEDRKTVFKWLAISLLKRTFGGQPDNVLRPVRQVLKEENAVFPLEQITEKLKTGTKSIVFTGDEIENLLCYKWGQNYTFSTLALLYPSLDFRNKFHVDHIFPRRLFTKLRLRKRGIPEEKIEFYLDNYNYLGNLQLLEGLPNQEKSGTDFEKWLFETYPDKTERKEFMKKNFIADVDLSLSNFEEFFKQREKLIGKEFEMLLEA